MDNARTRPCLAPPTTRNALEILYICFQYTFMHCSSHYTFRSEEDWSGSQILYIRFQYTFYALMFITYAFQSEDKITYLVHRSDLYIRSTWMSRDECDEFSGKQYGREPMEHTQSASTKHSKLGPNHAHACDTQLSTHGLVSHFCTRHTDSLYNDTASNKTRLSSAYSPFISVPWICSRNAILLGQNISHSLTNLGL